MNILIVGSGGREHALAWKIAQSARLKQLYTAPGNPGTASLGKNVSIAIDDIDQLVCFAREREISLVVIGPEIALANGLSDALRTAGIPVFGPSKAAAQIEISKSFAKEFMVRYGIPTARYAVFNDPREASNYLRQVDYPVVIKASGLAAGKGVLLPETLEQGQQALDQLMVEKVFGSAGEEVVIEERLYGEEISLLAFTDGMTVFPMPPTQDYKRLLEGGLGPNTGGMGAFAPAPILQSQDVASIMRTILQPAVDGMQREGTPYAGVLYAGIILTDQGPQVLEFNARFGDPETQVILPLLDDDLLDVMEACVKGRLQQRQLHWKDQSAVCVVMVSGGYPGSYQNGKVIHGLESLDEDAFVFHAGTSSREGKILSAGGRVLGVTTWAEDLPHACESTYQMVNRISFENAFFRKDIARGVRKKLESQGSSSAYKSAGVDIDAGNYAVKLMGRAVRATYNEKVLAGLGAFGGLYDASEIKSMHSPVLVASTDGVGTKVKLAAGLGRYDTVGEDIVNHCIDDILVQGARPLFFLDYFASSKLDPEVVAAVVGGIARACSESGVVLLGGETAEMPGVYATDEFDVAGTIVGVMDREYLLPRDDIRAGDVLIGLRSSGPHTNGYSLIRKLIENEDLGAIHSVLGCSLADALMAPHRSYLNLLIDLIEDCTSPIKALAHITGGGFVENIPRVIPNYLSVLIQPGSWPIAPIFSYLQGKGAVSEREMFRVFNMGIGMVAVVDPQRADEVLQRIDEKCWVIGKLIENQEEKVLLA